MYLILFPFLISILFIWVMWIWKDCYKAFPFCIIFIIEISWGLLSIGWIDSGTYISEQYRNSHFIGAVFSYLILMAPFAYIFPKYLQKFLIKNKYSNPIDIHKYNYNKIIWYLSIAVVVYLLVDLFISGIPLFNPDLSKVGYYSKWSTLPFAGKLHSMILPYIVLICGVKLTRYKPKSKSFNQILLLTISIFILQILLDYKFYGLYDYLVWLFIPIISHYLRHYNQRIPMKLIVTIISCGILFLAIGYLKYSKTYTNPLETLFNRIFSLQSHTFWGVDLLVKEGEMGFNLQRLINEIGAGFDGIPLLTGDYGIGHIMYAITKETTAYDLIRTGILFSGNFITVSLSYSGYFLTFIYSTLFGLISAYLVSYLGYYMKEKNYVMLFIWFFIYRRIYEYFRVGNLSILLSWKFFGFIIFVLGIQIWRNKKLKKNSHNFAKLKNKILKTSVVISTYNGQKYIEEELESIKNQTLLPDEVLIFDDGSSDETVSLIKRYINSNKLKSWKIIKNEKNKGWKKNFMEGIKQASGDIVFIADQDDIWMPEKIENMLEIMKNNNGVLLLSSRFIPFVDDWQLEAEKLQNQKENNILTQVDNINRFFAMDYPGCTYSVRKDFFNQIYSEWNPNFAHDAFLWRYALAKNGAYVLNKTLHLWRKHSESTYAVIETRNQSFDFRYDALELYDLFLNTFLSSKEIDNEQKEIFKKYKEWIRLRKLFYKTRNPIYGFRLATFLDNYRDIRQYFGDWIISYKYK